MKTITRTVKEMVSDYDDNKTPSHLDVSPLPLSAIPNQMGINLCSVEAITWTRQDDGQLVSLTIHFIPENKT